MRVVESVAKSANYRAFVTTWTKCHHHRRQPLSQASTTKPWRLMRAAQQHARSYTPPQTFQPFQNGEPFSDHDLSILHNFLHVQYPCWHEHKPPPFSSADTDAKTLNLWHQFENGNGKHSAYRTFNTAVSIAHHRLVTSEPQCLPIYVDGSCNPRNAGVGIVVPSKQHIAMMGTDQVLVRRRIHTALTELLAIVMGLECGAQVAEQGQTIALFTDSTTHRWTLDQTRVAEEPAVREVLRRLMAVLERLKDVHVGAKLHWLSRDYQIPGNMIAHRAAQRACSSGMNEYKALNWRTWQSETVSKALEKARMTTVEDNFYKMQKPSDRSIAKKSVSQRDLRRALFVARRWAYLSDVG